MISAKRRAQTAAFVSPPMCGSSEHLNRLKSGPRPVRFEGLAVALLVDPSCGGLQTVPCQALSQVANRAMAPGLRPGGPAPPMLRPSGRVFEDKQV